VRHEVGQEEAGKGAVIRRAINSLSKLRWFAPTGMAFATRFVDRALSQVTRYLTEDAIRSAALQAVRDLVGPETKVLIGHSLGSVVAYEAAHLLKQPLDLLLTIGSPLGLQNVVYQRLRPQPPTFPPGLRRWVNVADPDDFIAAEPDLRSWFSKDMPSGSVFDGTYVVVNGPEPHDARPYLTSVAVGKVLCQELRNLVNLTDPGPNKASE
jgi:pimeloyl-ACP methyl ester carboxylesterase